MARYTKNPGTKPTANPKVDRADVKKLREAMRNRVVWQVAHGYFEELGRDERDILAEYVRTKGRTDWVFLEEGLSATLDDIWQRGTNAERLDLAEVWNQKLSLSDWNHQGGAAYMAAFAIVIGAIRMQYPSVMPPTWFTKDVWPLLIGTDTPDDMTSTVIRDALLEGADHAAIQMLLAQGGFGGASIFWNEEVFAGNLRGGSYVTVKPPVNTHYIAMGVNDGDDGPQDPHEAVGIAIQQWKMWGGFAYVKVSTPYVQGSSGRAPGDELEDLVIFAIAGSQTELELGLRNLKTTIG